MGRRVSGIWRCGRPPRRPRRTAGIALRCGTGAAGIPPGWGRNFMATTMQVIPHGLMANLLRHIVKANGYEVLQSRKDYALVFAIRCQTEEEYLKLESRLRDTMDEYL